MAIASRIDSARARWRTRARLSTRRRVMIVLAVLALAAAMLGLLAHYRAPRSTMALAVTSFSPYLGIAAVVSATLFALTRSTIGWLGLTVSLLLLAWNIAIQLPSFTSATPPARGTDVMVMTSNLKLGGADVSSVLNAVRRHHVDVLMLEELTPDIREHLGQAGLDALLPHSVSDPRTEGAGTGLWSRYPLTDTTVSRDLGFSFITAAVALPGVQGATSLVALHAFGPVPQAKFARWAEDMGQLPGLLRGLTTRTAIVGGDFNATPDSAQFRAILGTGLADAAAQSGAGFSPTWPADRWYPPLLTIDHVLLRGAVARSADTIEIPGSDHRALFVPVRVAASNE